ncbi:hypothetical protein BN946_scf184798.g12 [Trametes cinnabarina]|uniref:Uncharacterized protein n=1 Tax=Pycnoporus cinnabarinus TaxID=5643 RepID=A0A060S890_PYCCI|nr:hypothetical protein BN946_scf184798.g12 [Trametes cinnabarina]
MASLTFAVKFSMTFLLIGLHIALFFLFVLSLSMRTGGNTEAIALGIEVVQLILLPIRLYFYIRYRDTPSRLKHERTFFLCMWLIGLTGTVWISIHSPNLLDAFAKLPHPDVAAIVTITFAWLAWTLTVHLLWISLQDANDAADDEEEPVAWPAYTSPPPIGRPKRISAKIVAVAHGSDPLLWARKKTRHAHGARPGCAQVPDQPRVGVQPAMPTYDPHDRQPGLPPQMKTTYNQWYMGEAV